MHLPGLVSAKLNILVGMKNNWLPPYYGKKSYEQMDEEEKAVIDDFQGKEAYKEVLLKKDYYLSAPKFFQLQCLPDEHY